MEFGSLAGTVVGRALALLNTTTRYALALCQLTKKSETEF